MNCTQQAWAGKKVANTLFMDAKSAINNVSKAHLGRRMEPFGLEPDITRRTGSFVSDRRVKLVLDGEMRAANPVNTRFLRAHQLPRSSSSPICRPSLMKRSELRRPSSPAGGGGQKSVVRKRRELSLLYVYGSRKV